MLGGGSSETGGESLEIEDRLSRTDEVETSETDEEESSESGDCCLGGLGVSSVDWPQSGPVRTVAFFGDRLKRLDRTV